MMETEASTSMKAFVSGTYMPDLQAVGFHLGFQPAHESDQTYQLHMDVMMIPKQQRLPGMDACPSTCPSVGALE